MYLLHHTNSLRVVGGGGDVLYPLLLTPVLPRARGELCPLSVVMRAGTPKQATHMVMKAANTVSMSIWLKGTGLWPSG